MSKDDLILARENKCLRSQIATLKNDEDYGIAKCDTFKAIYYSDTTMVFTRLEGME
ncbi:MAG: hypothetical protein RBT65_10455 [Methanolobus sp.]|jgi:hypothetical protein|nr:hypothetical protein [Methanolobus sp.]